MQWGPSTGVQQILSRDKDPAGCTLGRGAEGSQAAKAPDADGDPVAAPGSRPRRVRNSELIKVVHDWGEVEAALAVLQPKLRS